MEIRLKRFLCLLLTLVMVISLMPVNLVFAAEEENALDTESVSSEVEAQKVAEVDSVQYESLQAAIDAAVVDDTVILLDNVTLNDGIVIAADDAITLDLNGKTVSQTKAQTAGYQMILNDGNLTINDSVGTGKLSYTDSGNGGEYISDTIYNRGTLVINGGTIENLSSATVATNGYPHAVDNYSGIRDTSLTVNGGTIYCAEYSAIRMFCVSATYKADLTINGGTIKGAVDMQNGSKDAALGSLTIKDGVFETTKNANNIRFANWNSGAAEYGITASISGGTFNGGITTKYVPAAANWNSKIITGGTFSGGDVSTFVADGYKLDGGNVVADPAYGKVAKVGDTYYTDLQEAIVAAAPSSTVELLSDVTVDKWIMFSQKLSIGNGNIITLEKIDGLTIDGNGHKLTVKSVESAGNGGYLFFDADKLNVQDLTIECVDDAANAGGICLTSGNISNVTFLGGNGVFPGDGNITISGCTFENNYHAIYYEEERDNLVVTGNTFELADDVNVILLRGATTFTDNTVISGRTVNVVSGSPVVTGNDFNDVRLKVYNTATASISDNTINTLVFNDETDMASTFTNNTLSDEAQAALDAVTPATLEGNGTEEDPFQINTLDDLKLFRDMVNDGETFSGQYVKLTADIDLNSEAWTPIGNSTNKFLGTFDGGEHTISNLVVDVDTNNAGLFGYASVIKNLTINNANVSGVICVGAMVGELTNSVGTLDNCHVTGTIQITGENSVGGLAGKGYANIKNSSVTGDADSFVLGVYGTTEEGDNVGGIIGHLGEGNTLGVTNVTVKNIVVKGTRKVGGVLGTTARANDNIGCTAENVTVECTATADYATDNAKTTTIGGIVGNYFGTATSGGILQDCVVTNLTLIPGFATSAGALAGGDRENNGGAPVGVKASDNTVTNVTGATNNYLLPAYVAEVNGVKYSDLQSAIDAAGEGDTVTIFEGTYTMPTLKAGITVVGEGNVLLEGTLSGTLEDLTLKNLHIKGANAQRWAYAKGDLVFENVTFEATSVYALHFDGITEGATLLYKDCTIIGWAALGGSPASCTFDGCTIKDNGRYGVIRTYFDTTITDCTFDVANADTSDVYQDGIHAVGGAEVTVDDCTNANGEMIDLVNISGTSVVVLDDQVIRNAAKIGDTYYTTLADAIAAAADGDTITLMADLKDIGDAFVGGKTVTIDGNGHTVSGESRLGASYYSSTGNITFKNINFKDITPGKKWSAITVNHLSGTLTVDNCTFTNVEWDDILVASNKTGAKVVITNCTFDGSGARGIHIQPTTAENAVMDITIENNKFYYNEEADATSIGVWFPSAESNIDIEKNYVENPATISISLLDDGVNTNFSELALPLYNEALTEEIAYAAIVESDVYTTNFYATLADAIAAAGEGDTVTLLADVALDAPITVKKSITLDGAGYSITQSAACNNNIALLYFEGAEGAFLDVTVKNVTFDGLKTGAAIRTLYANMTIDGCVFQNCEHTVGQGLVRLTYGNATITGSKFLDNDCSMAVSFNWDADATKAANDTLTIENCEFSGNTANKTALVYYVKGVKCTLNNNKFIGNTVNCADNGAVVYMGFTENNVITGNLFKENVVTEANASTRVAGAIFFGYETTVTNNAFINNTASNSTGAVLGQVCTSTYYKCSIDLSKNYWGGAEPVYGKDYTIQHQTGDANFVIDSYYASYDEATNTVSNLVATNYAAQVGKVLYKNLLDALKAAKDGETVTMLADTELYTRLIFSLYTAGKNVTLDGNGHRLYASSTNWGTGNGKHLINVNCDNVTLKDIVLDCNKIAEGANIYMAQNIVFDNVSIINKKGWNADLTVNGSTLTVENKLTASYVDVSLGKNVTTDLGIVAEEGAVLDVRTLQIATAGYPNTNLDAALSTDGTSYYSFKKVDANGDLAGYSNSLSRLSNGYGYELLEDATVASNVTLLNAGHTGSLNTNGHTLTVANGKTLTVNGDLAVTGTGTIAGDIALGNEVASISGVSGLDVTTTVDGYAVEYVDGKYQMVPYVAQIGDTYYKSLQAAVKAAANGDTVTVLADINLTMADAVKNAGDYAVLINVSGKSITLDMNGKTISVVHLSTTDRIFAVICVEDGASLTVTGDGKIDVTTDETTPKVAYLFWKRGTTGALVIKNGTYHMNNSEDSMVYTNGSQIVTVEGGTFTIDAVGSKANGFPCIFNVAGQNQGNIIITGGTFNTDINHQYYAFEALVLKEYALKNNGDNTWSVVDAVAYVGEIEGSYTHNVGYVTLEEAIAAADAGETVTLLADIELTEVLTISADKDIVLNLNGKTISGTDTTNASFSLITNKGNLTVKDSVGTGKITLEATQDTGYNRYSTVISNTVGGKLTVESGTIEHLGGHTMAYAIDNLTNGKGTYAETVINGGTVKSSYVGIRQFLNGVEAQNILTVNGGTVTGNNTSIFFQDPSKNCNSGKLYVGNGATLGNRIYVSGTAGTDWDVDFSVSAQALGTYGITTDEIPETAFVKEVNGAYVIIDAVATVNGVGYKTLAEAIAGATAGDTVIFIADITEDVTVTKNLTIDGANFTYTGTMTVNTSLNTIITNVNFVGAISEANGTHGHLTIKNCSFDGADKTIAYAITQRGGDKLTIENTTAKNYSYGMVYIPSAVAAISVKNVTVEGVTAAFNISYSGNGTFENVTVKDATYGLHAQNHGARTFTLTGCKFDCTYPVYVQEKGTATVSFALKGNNTFVTDTAYDGQYAELLLDKDAVLTASECFDVIASDEGYVVVYENGAYTVAKAVAKIGDTYYATLAEAVAAVQEGQTITVLAGELSEGTIKLPATLKNVTFKGEEGAILKDMTIMAFDGNSFSYEGLTFDGITFENSRITFTGWRNGGAVIKDLAVTNCTFQNLNDTTNSAPVHINMAATEAVENFTFTGNVIDGATGGSKSGIYAQVTGNVVVKDNIINNVSFRPYVIQVTTDDGIADNFTVTGNTFSGSAAGRAQGLGNNGAGTDNVNLVVSGNIFKDITNAQQICYWNFNPETTTADLSKNYYDIDILKNPSKIYYNSAAANAEDLIEMGVYPYYADEAMTTLVTAPAIMVTYPDGTVEYFNEMSEAVPYTTNCPRLEGATVKLLCDIEAAGIRMMENDMVLDLNGHTYTIVAGTGSQGTNTSGFQIRPEVTTVATIKNGTIQVAEGAPVVWMFNVYATDFVVEDVIVDCANMAYSYGESCYVSVSRSGDNVQFTGNTQIKNFNSEVAGNAINVGDTMTIGENVVPGGSIELDAGATLTGPENLDVVTVEGYAVVYENGVYTSAVLVAQIGDVKYTSLAAALAAVENGGVITMIADATEVVNIPDSLKVTLDLNGKTLNGSILAPNAELTVTNGSIKNTNSGVSGLEINAGKLTLTDMNIDSARHAIRIDGAVEAVINSGTYRGAIGNGTGTYHAANISGDAVVTIKDGTFVGPQYEGTTADSGSALCTKSTVYIEGGSFSGGKLHTLVAKDSGTLAVSGGTFDQPVAEEYCAEGYIPTDNGDGTYGVKVAPKAHFESGAYASTAPAKPREHVGINVYDIVAYESLVIKVYDTNGNHIVTSTYRDYDRDDLETYRYPLIAPKSTTVNIVVSGKEAGSWDNVWHIAPSVDNIPATFQVWVDGELKDTWTEGFKSEAEKNDYCAFEGVYKVATVTDAEGKVTYYTTIADALAAANAGDTVMILAGTYDAFSVNKAITVIGQTDADGNNLVNLNGKLSVTGTGVTVKNLNVNNSGNAVYVSGGNILIEGCNVTGGNGLRSCYANNGDVTLKDCVITGNTYGVHFDAGNGDGDVIINGCTITGWTSFGSAIEEVRISDTTFAQGGYNKLRLYQNAKLDNVTFNPNMSIDFGVDDVDTDFTNCSVTDGSALTDVIYLPDIVEMGVNVTVDGKPVIIEAAVTSGENKQYYLTLAEAIAAAGEGDTVTVLENIQLTETVTVPAAKTITLDLNGKTVSMEDASGATAALLKNNGTLTIKDSVGEGKLTFHSTTPSAANGYASNTISNHGTITIESGIIENTTVGGACYALDNYAGSTATISGGELNAEKTTVRVFTWTNGTKSVLNVNGGTIYSKDGYGINFNMGNAPAAELNITGGTITTDDTDYDLAVYVANQGSAENVTINVSGGTFGGYFALNGKSSTTMAEDSVSISGGTFEGVTCYGEPAYGFVSGGIFNTPVAEEYCAEGYIPTAYENGTYGVKVGSYVAQVGDTKYETLAEAVEAVADGGVIELLADCGDEMVFVKKQLTIIRNGFALTENLFTIKGYGSYEDGDKLVVVKMEIPTADAGEKLAYIDINNDGYVDETLMTLQAALDAAAVGDTVKLKDNLTVNAVVIIPNDVTLDIESHTLTVKAMIALNGGKLLGAYDSKKNDSVLDGGLLKVSRENLVLNAEPATVKGIAVLPIWDPTAGNQCYRFSQIIVNTDPNSDARRGLHIDKAENTIKFSFKNQATTDLVKPLLENYGGTDLGFSVVARIEWKEKDSAGKDIVEYHNFVYSDETIILCATNHQYYFSISNFSLVGIDLDTLKVQATFVTDSGATAYSEIWTIDNADIIEASDETV